MSTHTHSYSRTNSIKYLADNMGAVLRDVIREHGLSPAKLTGDWDTIVRGVTTWTESGHLKSVTIEFFKPETTNATARWDFPVAHSGSGVDDDMWMDKSYLRQLIAKSAKPSPSDTYRVMFSLKDNAPEVDGFVTKSFHSTGLLKPISGGTVIATGHVTAAATYWR